MASAKASGNGGASTDASASGDSSVRVSGGDDSDSFDPMIALPVGGDRWS